MLKTNNSLFGDDISLFTNESIFINDSTIRIYGSWRVKEPIKILVETNKKLNYNIITSIKSLRWTSSSKFFIEISGDIKKNYTYNFIFKFNNDNDVVFKDIMLEFPFENNIIQDLNKDSSIIIVTFTKNMGHRLKEWIDYHIKLGVGGIIIFDNDNSKTNTDETLVELDKTNIKNMKKPIKQIIKEEEYKKVIIIDFPYITPGLNPNSKLKQESVHCWGNPMSVAFNLGFFAYYKKCKFVTFIDTDEFIHIPNMQKINKFLKPFNHGLIMQSNLITNKNNNDIINNNILDLCTYLGPNKYTKVIVNTNNIKKDDFIMTSHRHDTAKLMDKKIIIHYHAWANKRLQYLPNMKEIKILKEMKYK